MSESQHFLMQRLLEIADIATSGEDIENLVEIFGDPSEVKN